MPQVTFVQADGTTVTVTVANGASVMDAALDNDVSGIRGQCGGACTCATCHCYLLAPAAAALPAPHPDELEMLSYVWRRRVNSRLACQIRLGDGIDAVMVALPERQG